MGSVDIVSHPFEENEKNEINEDEYQENHLRNKLEEDLIVLFLEHTKCKLLNFET